MKGVKGLGLAVLAASMTCATGNAAPKRADWTLVTEQDLQSPLARIRVTVRSGSVSDPAELPGLAHYTARGMLRGTTTRPYKELTESIERLGGALSVRVDSTETVFTGSVLAKNLDPFLDLLRDVLTNPAFDIREMDLLRDILQGELRSRMQDVQFAASRAAMMKLYAGTPLAISPEGTVDSLSRMTPVQGRSHFHERFVRENLVIGLASPLSDADAAARLEARLGDIPHGEALSQALPGTVVRGRHAVIVDRAGMSTVPLYIAMRGVSDADSERHALEAGNFVFGSEFTSRLMQVLRAENGWTYGAYSGYSQLLSQKREPGVFSIYTFPSSEFASLAIPKALSMLDEYVQGGVTTDEFVVARDALSNRYPFEIDTSDKRLAMKLEEILTGRPVESVEEYRKALTALDRSKVNQVVLKKTPTDDLVIAAVGDAAMLRPVLEALPGVESVEVVDVKP